MSHKCTRCGEIFIDGAAVILSGCPSCGWNKFLYVKGPDEEQPVSEGAGQEVLDEGHKQETPAEKLIKEIDEIIGIEKEERTVVEEDGDRVESVRILGPGSYELNLDSLLHRKEIVMAIKEDGTYALHLPSVFKAEKKEKKK
ncbi:Zn-ribbon domain-containing protein [uncultured Methanomethylovorans sp.]|uniref:Zn-ribbon domain-containing protein n=1 Tax=uncultured Methanomethylovorans sp. TaxID=183759 RepID=UPI002AA84513|nr:Zn-ribbon domain-containing protein [uncultured Methanomethylovorans sp.]